MTFPLSATEAEVAVFVLGNTDEIIKTLDIAI
jgi:hypothetical protein